MRLEISGRTALRGNTRLAALLAAALASGSLSSCTCSNEEDLRVVVRTSSAVSSTHACILVRSGQLERRSAAAPFDGKQELVFAVFRGDLDRTVQIVAYGLNAAVCDDNPSSDSEEVTAVFGGDIAEIFLQLEALPCADPGSCSSAACEGRICDTACRSGDRCLSGVCQGGTDRTCTPPNECFTGGACALPGGCQFTLAAPRSACDSGNGECRADGGCTPSERGASCANGADDDGDSQADCDDSSCDGQACDAGLCVVSATCSSGTCQGTPRTCPPPGIDCREPSCDPGTGCTSVLAPSGTPCTGGFCDSGGVCQPAVSGGFPYTPSNFVPGPSLQEQAANTGNLFVDCTVTFDSSPDAGNGPTWCNGQAAPVPVVASQDGGSDLVILPMTGLQVTAAGNLVLAGSRPVVFAVYGNASIDGDVFAGAVGGDGGVGVVLSDCTGMAGGEGGDSNSAGDPGGGGGGGGGGHGNPGAVGGRGGQKDNNGGDEGTLGGAGGSSGISPLRGGCPGGAGGLRGASSGSTGPRAAGGGGGGAVQVSAAGTLSIGGRIHAGGGGGRGTTAYAGGGGGGGSGGGILLEASVLQVGAAVLAANGGGGASGAYEGTDGNPGQDGQLGTSPASGGPRDSDCTSGCSGGNGAAGTSPAVEGLRGKDGNASGGGGGGGGLGRIYLRGVSSCSVDAGVVVSGATTTGCP